MYCPKCAAPLDLQDASRCSHCELPLGNLKEIVTGRTDQDQLSPQQKGVRQGVMTMLLSLILIPAYVLLAALFPPQDVLIESTVSDTPFEKISQAVLWTVFLFGAARVLYAYLFQSNALPGAATGTQSGNPVTASVLPPAQSIPASGFGSWRDDANDVASSQETPELVRHSDSREQNY